MRCHAAVQLNGNPITRDDTIQHARNACDGAPAATGHHHAPEGSPWGTLFTFKPFSLMGHSQSKCYGAQVLQGDHRLSSGH